MERERILLELARRYVWWKAPEEAVRHPVHVLCQVMQLATYEDVERALSMLGEDAFRAALGDAPPGVLDDRSWTYWHLRLLGTAPPPLPRREIGA